ncbi:carboxypeptidase-like regulatory domain-containing protein [Maribacter sp. MMG018]|uniref:carboxypeptidase-like regulatory domain-containing protein n=1 Tax=Maribacter sp. MMG018 TaxID=2822688 RepID=UPI001B3613CF|nr:carboxypeptidase-like regulatory domain-containing protein [Maribacter sp. MMG018]MBQ4915412.1 carboxypeptidase-like regulatory domain-containing protein [Maribacter sp. MMG018]
MRRLLPLFVLFFGSLIFGQENESKFNFEFENEPLANILAAIEKESEVVFFYEGKWLLGVNFSGKFSNAPLSEVLEKVFDKTNLNFFEYSDDKIILTQNNSIYKDLPEGFFGREEDSVSENPNYTRITSNPVFSNIEASKKNTIDRTVRIGKENLSDPRTTFKISGYARTKEQNQPISNLSIILNGKNTGTATNDNGYYELEVPAGTSILKTSSLGIESSTTRIIVFNDGQLNFNLNESVEFLDEVIVEANAAKNVEEALSGSTDLVVEETKNIPLVLGERDVLKVATTLPGISTAGEGAAGFNVRGGSTDQNLILLDNAVIYNPSHFFGIFQALNPFTTKDLKILKGGIPAQYGGRLSSVFDITSKDANNEKFSGEAAIGPVTSNVALEIPVVKGKSGLLVGGRGTYSGWILRSLDDESLSNSEASFYDAIAKYTHVVNEKNTVKAMGYYSRDAFSITSDSVYGYSNRLLSFQWDRKFNDKNTGSLVVANSNYKFNIAYEGNSDNNFDLGFVVDETEAKLKFSYLHSKAHKFDYGLSAKLYNVQPGNLEPNGNNSIVEPKIISKEKAFEAAIYLSDNFEVNDKLLIDVGLRYSMFATLGPTNARVYEDNMPKNEETLTETVSYDNNEIVETYGGPEIRLSARYFLGPDLSVKASYNTTYQYIHRLSNTTTISPIDTWKLSDNNIKPQKGRQVGLGLYKNLDGNKYEISLEGYYKEADNLLDFKVGSELLLNETIETETLQGDGHAYGVEFLIRKNSGKLNGWLGYTYSRSFLKLDSEFAEERVNNGEYFPTNYDKPHDFSAVLNYKLTKRFSLSANLAYQTGRPVTYPVARYNFNNSEYVVYSDRNEFRIPDYYRLDLGLNIEGNHKKNKLAHSFWNISVYNVLGRNNPYSVFFVTENGELNAYQSSIFSIPVPTITYNFKF